jgi:hypothetical protein
LTRAGKGLAVIVPNEGLLEWLFWAFDDSDEPQEDFVVDIFQNNFTPTYTSTGSDFTVASFPGYSQVALPRASFTTITAMSGVGTIVSTISPTWTCTGGSGQTVYGWYMRGASSGKVLGAQLFPTAPVLTNGISVSLGPMTWQMGQGS